MENLWSREHTVNLFEMYEKELNILFGENEELHHQNAEIRVHFRKKLEAERKKNMALSQEIDKLKELQAADPNKAIGQLHRQLRVETNLRLNVEAKAERAVQIADHFLQKLEEIHNVCQKCLAPIQIPDANLKRGVDDLSGELLELKLMLRKEKESRAHKGTHGPEVFTQAHIEVSSEVLDHIGEETSNSYMELRKERDELLQEILVLHQRESNLRDEIEWNGLREFEILEMLCREISGLETLEKQHLCQDMSCEEERDERARAKAIKVAVAL
ncbi:uncharacterized protein LOC114154592 isoform X2 [Xiphophorus couchianus]|uniref:uncharacterized protein LOC114154592 isoform X2 n=1 Tax=Xiphophorus couchianus TaxID=32473 RepID=UPI00101720AF|nr:uncharacterized protein LOC114154592 isoform X2 [Xiphophorus couchianus]